MNATKWFALIGFSAILGCQSTEGPSSVATDREREPADWSEAPETETEPRKETESGSKTRSGPLCSCPGKHPTDRQSCVGVCADGRTCVNTSSGVEGVYARCE